MESLQDFIRRVLKSRGDIRAIVLYGSLARGDEKPFMYSDVDVLIVADNLPSDPIERKNETMKLKKLPSLIDDLWVTPKELFDGIRGGWGVIIEAVMEGKVIYDPYGLIEEARKLVRKLYVKTSAGYRFK